MKISERSKKLAGLIEQLLPPIIHQRCMPDEVGFLTITAIEVSGDLGVADVFVRSLNGPASYLTKLKRQTKPIERELMEQLNLRRAVILRFKPDKSVQHTEKMKPHFS